MRLQALIPTLLLTLAWILSLVALLAGRGGQMLDLHAGGVNISRVGMDLLADSSVINLDTINIVFKLWGTSAIQFAQSLHLPPQKTSWPMGKRDVETFGDEFARLWEDTADWMLLDQNETFYHLVRDISIALGDNLKKKNLLDDINRAVETSKKSLIKRGHNISDLVASPSLSFLPSLSLSPTPLASPSSSSISSSGSTYSRVTETQDMLGAPPLSSTSQQTLTAVVSMLLSSLLLPADNSTNLASPTASLFRPVLVATLRATANTLLNTLTISLREGFAVPDWAAMYQTQWCWGSYHDNQSEPIVGIGSKWGRGGFFHRPAKKKRVLGCADSGALMDLNLAPGFAGTLRAMEVAQGDMPRSVALPGGAQRVLDGVTQFSHAVFAVDVALVALTGLVMLVSMANCVLPERFWVWSDFLTVVLSVASCWFITFVGSAFSVFIYFNGLVIASLLGLANIGYENGWRFVCLFIGAEIMTLIATTYWIVLKKRADSDRLLSETIIIAAEGFKMG